MFERIDGQVLLNTMDKSPKFRKDYILIKISENEQMIRQIIDLFSLDLVNEIYIIGLKVDTYNSKKRQQLKEQEVILIKKVEIYRHAQSKLAELLEDTEKIELMFSQFFDYQFHIEGDRRFARMILDETFEELMNKYEENKK